MATTPRLQADYDAIQRMELDLVSKISTAFTTSGLSANIHGVFSVDDLESKQEADLCGGLAVGVGYHGAESADQDRMSINTAPGGSATKMVNFMFHVILAVPHGQGCLERYDATRLMTVMRRSILGTSCAGDATNRTWVFVREFPNISESTDTLLYYSQVWRLSLPESRQ